MTTRRISFKAVDPAKLQSDAVLDSDDEEVRHIAPFYEVQRPQSVDMFADTIAEWLRESYTPPKPGMVKTQTHTGCPSTACSQSQNEQCAEEAVAGGRPLARTQSYEPDLELKARPFFDRSATFLRLKQPLKFGRGYGRGQPFKAQDIDVWRRIKDHDWSPIIDKEMSILVFVNYWFEYDFTWEVLEHMFALDPTKESFHALIVGDAQLTNAVIEPCVDSSPLVQCQWTCQVCKDENEGPSWTSKSDEGPHRHDFCSWCQTNRYDRNMWLCRGPPSRTWPRTKSKPCHRALQMFESPVGVPCCSACETVRHNFQEDDVFGAFSNTEDEPLPEKTFRAN